MKPEPSALPLQLHKRPVGALFFSALILLLSGYASSPVPPAIGKVPEKPVLVSQT